MFHARVLAPFAALVVAGFVAGCGDVVGFSGAAPPTHTATYPSERAPALPPGVDPMAGLQQRPMRPPAAAQGATCSVSSAGDLGAGVGPAFLAGQDAWYAGGQAAILAIGSSYSGPLLARPFQLGGAGKATVTLAEMSLPDNGAGARAKEKSHGVNLVPAVHVDGGGLYIGPTAASSFSRAWLGTLGSDGPGCFGLQVDGDVFTEFIVFEVNPGNAPPG